MSDDLGGDSGGGGGTGGATSTDTGGQAPPSASGRTVGDTPDASDTGGAERRATAAAEKKEAARLYKVKRGGTEREIDGDELAKRYSDDYEHEFVGPGGKPIKKKWDDVSRAVQLSEGAAARATRAAQLEQRLAAEREAGKKNPRDYLRDYLGIDDPKKWVFEQAREDWKRNAEIEELLVSDPQRAREMIQEDARLDAQRVTERERAAAQARSDKERSDQATREATSQWERAFQGQGLTWTDETIGLARAIVAKYQQSDVVLPMAEVATLVKRELHTQRRKEFASMPIADLHALLGPEITAAWRAHDVAALKGERAAAKVAAPPATNGAGNRGAKQYTERELRDMERGR